jgi:hypothetical protein
MNKAKTRLFSALLVGSCLVGSVSAQGKGLGGMRLVADPELLMPIGDSASVAYFELGYGGRLGVDFPLPPLPALAIRTEAAYSILPLADTSISLIRGGLGATLTLQPLSWLELGADLSGGYFYGSLTNASAYAPAYSDQSQGGGYASGGLSFSIKPLRTFSLGLELHYLQCLGDPSLYTGLGASLSAKLSFLSKEEASGTGEVLDSRSLKIEKLDLSDVFPVYYSYYADHPLGTVTISNTTKSPIKDLRLSVEVKQFMEGPRETAPIPLLKSGESRTVELSALFTDSILSVTEGSKVALSLVARYKVGERPYRDESAADLKILYRNAISWDDDRRVAAFVTAKDPGVLALSKNALSAIRGSLNPGIDDFLQEAAAIHEAVSLLGMNYVIDPKTPYADFSKTPSALDFVQFPRETLRYKGGDCDDLSVLTCALLESVGIETAFITIPGHIYMAFALKSDSSQAKAAFSRPEDLIIRGDKAWVPLEITDRKGGFAAAWRTGAQEWRDAGAKASFLPVHESWKTFSAVGLPGNDPDQALDAQALAKTFKASLSAFVAEEIGAREPTLKAAVQNGGKPRAYNNLGLLYARFGDFAKAATQFESALKGGDYVPALINLGTVKRLAGDSGAALSLFRRAYDLEPSNAKLLASYAGAAYEAKAKDEARKIYGELSGLSPDLAKAYSYIAGSGEDASRASDAGAMQGSALWEER